jgi:hypothetical protein
MRCPKGTLPGTGLSSHADRNTRRGHGRIGGTDRRSAPSSPIPVTKAASSQPRSTATRPSIHSAPFAPSARSRRRGCRQAAHGRRRDLCRELGVTPQTLYRHVDPGGALREGRTPAARLTRLTRARRSTYTSPPLRAPARTGPETPADGVILVCAVPLFRIARWCAPSSH